MMRHQLLGGKVQLYQRSQTWWCSASIAGKQRRKTTGQESLSLAREVAEDWYLTLAGKNRAGLPIGEKTLAQAAKKFLDEYEITTEGQRSPKWVRGHNERLRLHLLPFFGSLALSEVTAGKVQDYRVERIKNPKSGKPPARNTLHNEIGTLRLVLKTAIRHGWISYLPDLSVPYKGTGKVGHRPWFSAAEYKQLYEASRTYAQKPCQEQHRWNAEQVHDYILFLANTGLRPDEAKNLQHRDVTIVKDEATGQRILEIEVRGKRGVGYCKSMPNAVRPYQRLLNRPKPGPSQTKRARRRRGENISQSPQAQISYPQPTDQVFPGDHKKLFNGILKRAHLKFDRDENRRTSYSLRHTYICLRLMEGADIYQIAKNCRTSVEMIEKHYATHIKNVLDAAAINVVRKKSAPSRYQHKRQAEHLLSRSAYRS